MSVVDPIKALDEIAKWERVWIEVVALAWKDPAFRTDLLANGGKNARQVVKARFNEELPPDVDFRVVAADPSMPVWDATHRKHPRAMTTLTLTLPATPKLDDQAIALSDYVGSGYSMPFTCCC